MFLHWQVQRSGQEEKATYYAVTKYGTTSLVSGRFNNALDLSQGAVRYNTDIYDTVVDPDVFLGIELGLYCLEWWSYGTTAGTVMNLGSPVYNQNTVGTDWHTVNINNSGGLVNVGFVYYANGTAITSGGLSAGLTANQWNHIVLTKTSNSYQNETWSLRVNGATGSTFTASYPVNTGAGQVLDLRNFTIGATSSFSGPYMDEVRLSSSQRYGANTTYTVPTSEFSQDLNTKLLTHLDSSALPAYYATY